MRRCGVMSGGAGGWRRAVMQRVAEGSVTVCVCLYACTQQRSGDWLTTQETPANSPTAGRVGCAGRRGLPGGCLGAGGSGGWLSSARLRQSGPRAVPCRAGGINSGAGVLAGSVVTRGESETLIKVLLNGKFVSDLR